MAGSFSRPPVGSRPLTCMIARNRRSLAFIFAFLGVLASLAALRPTTPTWPALVAAADLPAGHVLAAGDIREVALTADVHPATAIGRQEEVVGRALAGPVAAGETLLTTRLVGPGLLGPDARNLVAMPLRVEDPAEVAFLRPGDLVDVLAADRGSLTDGTASSGGGAVTVARAARVLAVPGGDTASAGGLLTRPGGAAGSSAGKVLVVAVPARISTIVAGAAARSRLSVVARGS